MVEVEYYDLKIVPFNEQDEKGQEIMRSMCRSYKELKLKIREDFPELYDYIKTKSQVLRILDKDEDLSIIKAMSNRLSHDGIFIKVTIVTQYGYLLKPQVIVYCYNGFEER